MIKQLGMGEIHHSNPVITEILSDYGLLYPFLGEFLLNRAVLDIVKNAPGYWGSW